MLLAQWNGRLRKRNRAELADWPRRSRETTHRGRHAIARHATVRPIDKDELLQVQYRRDPIYRDLTGGQGVPAPMRRGQPEYTGRSCHRNCNNSAIAGRRRTCTHWVTAREVAEVQILKDARKAIDDRHQGSFFERGRLRRVNARDANGVRFVEFRGRTTREFMNAVAGHTPYRLVTEFSDCDGRPSPTVRRFIDL
jgi:hypothetical protein